MPIHRRHLLQTLAAMPVALPNMLHAQALGAGLIASNVCILAPELTEGPFYVDPKLIRRDITEGATGAPLALRLQVVTADCTPISGARVDVWHCDAQGAYSGVENGRGGPDTTGTTFLRGTQTTDQAGIASFQTIYPGWYPGRAVHIHYKVILNDQDMVTSQVFFDESVTAQVFGDHAAYATRGGPDVILGRDRIAQRAGDGAIAAVDQTDGIVNASLVIGVADKGGLIQSIFG